MFKIKVNHLELTQFTAEDTRKLYSIRYHPSVRQYMTNTALAPYKNHKSWVQKNLIQQVTQLLLIVKSHNQAIGFSVLRNIGESTEIGVMFREPNKHKVVTYTTAMTTLYLAFNYFNLENLVSYVIPEHHLALAFNYSFGAWQVDSDKSGLIKLKLNRSTCLNNPVYLKMLNRIKQEIVILDDLNIRDKVNLV